MPQAVVEGGTAPAAKPGQWSGLKLLLAAAHVITAENRCSARHIALAYSGFRSIYYSTPYVQTLSGLELCLIKMDQQRESGYAIGFVNFFLCSGRYDGRYDVRLFLFIARKIVG